MAWNIVYAGGLAGNQPISFSTDFLIAEDPLSESGTWAGQGKSTALLWNNVRVVNVVSVGHVAVGTQQDFGNDIYDDSNCLLNQNLGNDVALKATIYINPGLTGTTHEVGLLHRRDHHANFESGYEFLLTYSNLVDIIAWNGTQGDFTPLGTPQNAPPAMATGNVIKATAIGNLLKMYVNNVLVCSATDVAYVTGRHGINFFTRPGSPDNDFGFTNFQARTIDGSFDPVTW